MPQPSELSPSLLRLDPAMKPQITITQQVSIIAQGRVQPAAITTKIKTMVMGIVYAALDI